MILIASHGSLAFVHFADRMTITLCAPDVRTGPYATDNEDDDMATNELTPTERTLLPHLVEGDTNEEIAGKMGISAHTVKFHMNNVVRKLGGRNRVYAAVQAVRQGLVP